MDSRLYKTITTGDIDQLKQIISASPDHAHLVLHQTTHVINNTTLHVAVTFNEIKCAEEICRNCPSLLTKVNSKGDTPLHIAARLGLSDITSFLIDQSKSNHKDIGGGGGGDVVVHSSLSLSVLQQLMRMRNKENDTALHQAVRNHRFNIVKLLTEADLDFQYFANSAGETPLYLAAEGNMHEIVGQILETCPSSAHGGPLGRTALHMAVINNTSEILKLLLEKKQPTGTLIKEVDDHGCSALHYAAYYGNHLMIDKLLEADPSIAHMLNKDGSTALHVAASSKNKIRGIEKLTQSCPECWEHLDNKGRNFLHVAAQNGANDVIEYVLLQKSLMVDELINQPDNSGNTPLHLAIKSNKVDVARMLGKDSRVNKMAMNKEHLRAVDLLHVKRSSYFDRRSLEGHSQRNKIIKEAEYDEIEEIGSEEVASRHKQLEEVASRRKQLEAMEKISDTHLLVATLIATVTFAAGFTLPGGYNQDEPHKGMAVLARKPTFMLFVLSNTMAMLLSTFTVFLSFWSRFAVVSDHEEVRYKTSVVSVAFVFMSYAIIAMVIAFVTGTYVVLCHSPVFAVIVCILGCIFFPLGFLYFVLIARLENNLRVLITIRGFRSFLSDQGRIQVLSL